MKEFFQFYDALNLWVFQVKSETANKAIFDNSEWDIGFVTNPDKLFVPGFITYPGPRSSLLGL